MDIGQSHYKVGKRELQYLQVSFVGEGTQRNGRQINVVYYVAFGRRRWGGLKRIAEILGLAIKDTRSPEIIRSFTSLLCLDGGVGS
jgi:hypothetical protein